MLGAGTTSRAAAPDGQRESVVELRDVFCVHRTNEGDAAALQGVSLNLAQGELLCVLGPSGAGKTTLLRVIGGLQAPSAGVVRVLGLDIGRLPAGPRARLRRAAIGFLDQHAESALAPDLRVGQAVALPLAVRGVKAPARRARVTELLDAAGLGERITALPRQLSGGERQRVALCAALAHRPRLLLADEPTAELDEPSADAMRDLIAAMAQTHACSVIVVSHDAVIATRAQRAVRIRDGRIVEDRDERAAALVVDRSGWLRLPAQLRARAGIGERAHVRSVDGGLLVTAPDERPPQATNEAPARSTSGQAAAPARDSPLPVWEPVLVELRSVNRSRGDGRARRLVIEDLSLRFARGRMTAVLGRSGTGKTTLLRLLAALDAADSGELLIGGQPISGYDGEQLAALRRERIGYLPQEPSPVGFLSAAENVALVLRIRGYSAVAADERAAAVLARLALADRSRQRVSRLSAGEAQRVALARAMAGARGLLIVDEPTSRLDEANAAEVVKLLARAAAQDRQTVICATHDPELVRYADVVVEL